MRKKPMSLWKAGLNGAGFGVFINVINYSEGRFGPPAFFPPTPDQTAELAGTLMFCVILFVGVAEFRNWRLQRREERDVKAKATTQPFG